MARPPESPRGADIPEPGRTGCVRAGSGGPHNSPARPSKRLVERLSATMETINNSNITALRMLRQGNNSANVRSRGGCLGRSKGMSDVLPDECR
jgi:hypothetical protein